MRILFVALLLTGCATAQPEPVVRTVVKTKLQCPSDDALRDAAIAASKATYFKFRPNGCACKGDDPARCEHGAIHPAEWVICTREQVPAELIQRMKASCRPT